jgi:hypothetical protein
VAEIKASQALVAANRELITRFEKKYKPPLPVSKRFYMDTQFTFQSLYLGEI